MTIFVSLPLQLNRNKLALLHQSLYKLLKYQWKIIHREVARDLRYQDGEGVSLALTLV